MDSNGRQTIEISPIHRAIDRVSAILIEIQALHRHLDETGILHRDQYWARLTRISAELHQLAAALTHERDQLTIT